MKFENKQLLDKALEVKKAFKKREMKNNYTWEISDLIDGFTVDIGNLMELNMVRDGKRKKNIGRAELKKMIQHELCDCLWSLLVISHEMDINLLSDFSDEMDKLLKKLHSEK